MKKLVSTLIFMFCFGFLMMFVVLHTSETTYAANCYAYKNGNGCHMRINGKTYAYLTDITKKVSKNDIVKPYGTLPQGTIVQGSATHANIIDVAPLHCPSSDKDCYQDNVKPVTVVNETTNTTVVNETTNTTVVNETPPSHITYQNNNMIVLDNGTVLLFIDGMWHAYSYNG